METKRPLVAEIKRNSLDDGPGIRSVVFFKGCPLHCVWCHNPECIETGPELIYRSSSCVGCGGCRKVCPENAVGPAGPAAIDRSKCTLCGACVEECPSGSLSLIGKYYFVPELVTELGRDQAFYRNSGGGVTLSGGEPTLVIAYAAELARELKARGIPVLLETGGDFDWDRFQEKLLPHLDQIYIDLKLVDRETHLRYTKRDNDRILANLARLIAQTQVPVLVRVPLIPGITATPENLTAVARWLSDHGRSKIALLPYNPLWLAKAQGLGKTLAYDRAVWMTPEERAAVKKIFSGFELEREI